jgi:hypothetical protein
VQIGGRHRVIQENEFLLEQIGRWIIRYLIIIFLVAALTSQARADIIGYEMTGTVTSATVSSPMPTASFPLPVARGDRMTWTFQYDRSTPASGGGSGQISYTPNGPLIVNLVDQTNGYHWSIYPGARASSSLYLTSSRDPGQPTSGSSSLHAQSSSFGVDAGYSTTLNLGFNSPLPNLSLANVQLNRLPLNLLSSHLDFQSWVNVQGYSFEVSVNSISAPMASNPEPGSLTLFLLGAGGLLVSHLRSRTRTQKQLAGKAVPTLRLVGISLP